MNLKKLNEISLYKIFLLMANTIFSLYTANFLSSLTELASEGIDSKLWRLTITFLTILILYIGTKSLAGYFIVKRETIVKHQLLMSLYRSLFSLPPAELYLHNDAGEILETFRDDFSTAANLYCDIIPSVITSSISYLICLGYTGIKNWKIMLLMFALSQIQLIVPLLIESKFYENYTEDREWEAKVTNVEIEAHMAFQDICVFRLHKWYENYLQKFQKGAAHVGAKYEYLCGFGTLFENLVKSVLQYGTYIVIGIGVFATKLSIEDAVLLLYLSGLIYSSIMDVYHKITVFSESKAAVNRLTRLTKAPYDEGSVSLRDCNHLNMSRCLVSVEGQTILQTDNIEIQPDKTHIITGENGIGKSTLLKVLAGYIIPQEFICGQMSTNDTVSDLVYLPQKDMRLSESALELIDEEEREDFVDLCKNQFGLSEELISRSIKTLSGGENKKVFLSLALIKSRNGYLLLDEPSNHLDQAAKASLAKLIIKRHGYTVLVTHDEVLADALNANSETKRIHLKKEG